MPVRFEGADVCPVWRICIFDPNQSLVAVSLETGEQLWLFGEAGEGPGHFNGIGEIAASYSLVAV